MGDWQVRDKAMNLSNDFNASVSPGRGARQHLKACRVHWHVRTLLSLFICACLYRKTGAHFCATRFRSAPRKRPPKMSLGNV